MSESAATDGPTPDVPPPLTVRSDPASYNAASAAGRWLTAVGRAADPDEDTPAPADTGPRERQDSLLRRLAVAVVASQLILTVATMWLGFALAVAVPAVLLTAFVRDPQDTALLHALVLIMVGESAALAATRLWGTRQR